jgi:hypothetical protein
MAYAWIITIDHQPDTDAKEGTNSNAKGLIGPRRATDEQIARLRAGEGHEFQMRDDDGELYYTGRLIGDKDSEEAGFGPLDDFGMPNAGATSIAYRQGAVFVTL